MILSVWQPGQLLPGVINNHESYGIFVELPGGLKGLAPYRVMFSSSSFSFLFWYSEIKQSVLTMVKLSDTCSWKCACTEHFAGACFLGHRSKYCDYRKSMIML
jgi:hypothetical protein